MTGRQGVAERQQTAGAPRPGRRLTGGQIALIVVVVALVGVFLALLVGRLTGDVDPDGAATPTGTATAATPAPTADDEAGSDAGEPVIFAMPSGNIVCQISVDGADCLIRDFTYDPVDAASCEGEAGAHLRVGEDGASMPCEPLAIAGDVPALDYGESREAHGYTCTSSREGVTCEHEESGQGFSLARAAYELF